MKVIRPLRASLLNTGSRITILKTIFKSRMRYSANIIWKFSESYKKMGKNVIPDNKDNFLDKNEDRNKEATK